MNRRLQSIQRCARVTKAVVLLLFLCMNAAAQETTPISSREVKYRKQIFEDARFSAFLIEIPPNETSPMHRHYNDTLAVFVSGGESISTIYGKPPARDRYAVGEVRFVAAGFTHSTENIMAKMLRIIVLEFNSSGGGLLPVKPSKFHYCNPGTESACVDDKHLFCTARFCVRDISIAPGAIWRHNEYASDQLLVAVSDYKLSDQSKGKAAKVRKRKSGEVEYLAGGAASQWTNATNQPARIIAIVFQ